MPKRTPEPSTPGGMDRVPVERAHAALRRAAQLQADAIERLEQSARARIAAGSTAEGDPGGLERAEIEAAAAGAGISPEYLHQALMEQDAFGEDGTELAPWVEGMADRMLRTKQRTLEITRTVHAEPQAVLESMQRVLPAPPYDMTLVDAIGGSPLEGGVLVFDLPRFSMLNGTGTSLSYVAYAVDLLQVQLCLRSVPVGTGTGCEITLRADLRSSVRHNVFAGTVVGGVGAGLGALFGGFLTLVSGGIAPVIAAGALAGAGGLGAVGGMGYGVLYRFYLRKLVRDLETLLRVVGTNARTGGTFRMPQPRPGSGGETLAGVIGSL
jgi:hypothetical protein